MIVGVVGHAQEKFTTLTEAAAREAIRKTLLDLKATVVCSGHSPMGGVDIYAEEIGKELGIELLIHAPTRNAWDGAGGFKDRNLRIARDSAIVLCVVVAKVPDGFGGMKFKGCYHCRERNSEHVKSGGCWTAWKAPRQRWAIIQ